jgi:AcrR family transcriptional regulator
MARGTKGAAREAPPKVKTAGRPKPHAKAEPGQKSLRASGKSRPQRRALPPETRRAAILAAALEEFTARGYEGARLDDVAKRAGIAKGTIYLYFADKEALFQELVRSMVHPVLGMLEKMRGLDIPARMLVEGLLSTFVREVYGTRRKDLIRLILNEGPRFPAIAEFYYHEVIERVLGIVRPILKRAAERGELPDDALARFPQLIVAPMLVGIMWHAMFEKFEPLDIDAMVHAHIGILFARRAG